jgi:hypothetical protein
MGKPRNSILIFTVNPFFQPDRKEQGAWRITKKAEPTPKSNNLAVWNNLVKSLPASLFQREGMGFPLLTKGDEGGLDVFFKVLNWYPKVRNPMLPYDVFTFPAL